MKTKLQQDLARTLPSISIRTIWEEDLDADMSAPFEDGNTLEGENPDNWTVWQAEVRVTAIAGGELFKGSDYIGGVWEKRGDAPSITNPDISGYERQMTADALTDLLAQLPEGYPLAGEIALAVQQLES